MKLRPLGDVLLDLEVIINEMIVSHGLQKGDVLSLVNSQIDIHHPGAIEQYCDGSGSPVFQYGPPKDSE